MFKRKYGGVPSLSQRSILILYAFSVFSIILSPVAISSDLPQSKRLKFCESLLAQLSAIRTSPTARYQVEDWLKSYQDAHRENNVMGGAFALTQLLRLHHKDFDFSLRTRVGLKNYAKVLGSNQRQSGKDSLGNKIQLHHRTLGGISKYSKDFIWSFGPFGYRALPNWWVRHSIGKMQREIQDKVAAHSHLREILGIEQDEFFRSILLSYFKDIHEMKAAVRKNQKGYLWRPAALLLFSYLTAGATELALEETVYLHPLHAAAYGDTKRYPDYQFLEDLEKATQRSLTRKRVSFIIDKRLLMDAILNETPEELKPLTHFVEDINQANLVGVIHIREQASIFEFRVIDSIQELDHALQQSTNADYVFVNFHGLPGNFVVGEKKEKINDNLLFITPNSLKEDATLVFLSCSFGNRYSIAVEAEDQETWVRFSHRVLGKSGKAVAPVNDLSFYPILIPDDPKSLKDIAKLAGLAAVFFPVKASERLFVGPVHELRRIESANRDKPHLTFEKSSLAFRVLDMKTGKISLYKR